MLITKIVFLFHSTYLQLYTKPVTRLHFERYWVSLTEKGEVGRHPLPLLSLHLAHRICFNPVTPRVNYGDVV